ncbi:hypothetical protein MNV49_005421 [Pseudohyphozyma bogoriensis]|nr:hypothetical protein MNV49_005421 [Pseudohyphozyma bogoriensis]
MSALGPSFAPLVRANKGLFKAIKPVADFYAQLSGYRQHGLKYDDILIEENKVVQKALGRLSERESYDRAFRHRVASQASIAHAYLPKDKWVQAKDDVRYLKPFVEEIEKDNTERELFDSAIRKK